MKTSDHKNSYSKKLRDPRWQKARLLVMQRDDFACLLCGDHETTLNVHHTYYLSGCDPWDYPIESLQTLCEPCHEGETFQRPAAEAALLKSLRHAGISWAGIMELIEAFDGLKHSPQSDKVCRALCYSLKRDREDLFKIAFPGAYE